MRNARRRKLFRDVLLTTTALVAALASGGKGAAAGSASGLSGFQVQSGGATLSTPTPTKSVITQSTSKAIIGWSAFGIPAGSTVQFVQPGSGSVALNRVSGGNVSQILGNLSANGQVWIVNPAGVFFGAGAQVDVAGLMATTSDIQNGNFLSGNYQFGVGSQNPNASIVNEGTIRVSSGGSAVLSGARVDNQGLIEAQLGTVVLAGAKTFAVDFQGDKLLSFQVTGAVDQRPTNADGSPANALVTNSGTVAAAGGTVLITARAAKNIIDNVINSSGIVEAQSAQLVNGEIVLDGGDTGLVTVSGSLDASGKGAGETGGTVKVLGDEVNLAAGASIDVSGDAGGGTALIGGNFHGSGPEQNASVTVISANATINADAISTGNGGNVAVWSEQYTEFYGAITARGGTLSGNGGFVETSSRGILHAFGTVDVSSPYGTAGTWLLDPADVTIELNSGTVTGGTFTTNTLGGGTFTPGADATLSIIDPSVIDTALNNGGTVLINANGNASLSAGDILINANLMTGTKTGAVGTLTFTAGSLSGGISLGSGVTIAITGNSTDFVLNFNAGASGAITLGDHSGIGVTGNNSVLDVNFVAGTALGGAGSIVMGAGSSIFASPTANGNNPAFTTVSATFLAGPDSRIFLGNQSAIDTNGGDASFNRPIVLGTSGDTGIVTINTLNAQHPTQAGSIGFGSTVDAASNAGVTLVAGGSAPGSITLGGSIGGQTALSGLTLTSSVTLMADAVLNAGPGTLQVDAINAGSHNLTLEGDTINLTGGATSVSGTAFLTIEPFASSGEAMLIGGTVAPNSGLWVSDTSLSAFAAQFSGITFGPNAGSGTLTIGTANTFTSPTTFIEGVSGVVVVTQPLTGGSGAALTLQAGTIDLSNNVTTSNASIVISGGAVLGANATLSSGGGNIIVTGTNTINSAAGTAFTLSLDPGVGNVTLAGAIGGGTSLGALMVGGSGTTTLSGGTIATSGSIWFSEGVLLAGAETLTSAGGNISFAGAINGGFGLSLSAASGIVSLNDVGGTTPVAALFVDPVGIVLGGSTYHTTGGQTYVADVTLGADVSLTSDSGNIAFLAGIDGAHALSAQASLGSVSLTDAGGTTPLSSLALTASSVTLSGTTLHSSGGQSFSGPVVLTGNENIASDTGSVTFTRTVDGAQALSVTATSGSIGVGSLIGGGTALSSLTLDGKTVVLPNIGSAASDGVTGAVSITGTTAIDLGGSVYHSGGSESFTGPVVLLNNETVISDAGGITFSGTVDGAQTLTATATGPTTFDGVVGGTTPLSSLTVTHGADLNGGTITTSGGQTYDGPVTLTTGALLTGTAITFVSTVDGAQTLTATATGLTTFDGVVGGTTPLSSLTVTHGADLNGGTINTSGGQTYDGPVTLTSNALLTGTAITFVSTVDGAQTLTATATGLTTFDGVVGGITPLSSLTVTHGADLNGGTINTSGGQTYDGPVTLTSNALLTGTAITFVSTVDGAQTLTATATGLTTFDGVVGGTTALSSLTVTHGADLNGGTIKTSGGQTYDGPVTLTSNALLTGTAITFVSTVDGARTLTATATGLTTFDGVVGGTTPLSSLTVTHGADLNGGTITTSGGQTYDGPVTLTSNALLTGTAITFVSTVDGAQTLTATATGLTTFDGVVGGTTPLSSLTVTHGADLNGGTIDTSGGQTYDGPVTLTSNALLRGTAITFISTVDGDFGLTATATGLTTFDGAVGFNAALASLTVTNAADLNGGSVATTGAQSYGGPVTLSANALLTGGAITFVSTVDGAHGLTATATGLTTFDGAVGSGTALSSLTVTNGADINGGSVITTGAQNYDGPVTLGANATLTSVAGNVVFESTIDGGYALSVTATSGSIAFDSVIGGTTALTSLTAHATTVTLSGIGSPGTAGVTGAVSITGTGMIVANGATDHSGGNESFTGPVLLAGDATIISDAGNITFTGTVDGAHALSASASSGSIGVSGLIGSATPLASLTLGADTITLSGIDHSGSAGVTGTVGITGSSLITLGGVAYHSGGDQTYTGAVVLAADETVTSDTGNIGFGGPINGGFALSLFATAGTVSLGDVGTATKLASLLVDPAGILLDGTTYRTTGNQSYSQAVILGADATLTSDTGNIAFAGTIDGQHVLSVTASAGTVSVSGTIGGTTALTGLALNGQNGVAVTSVLTDGAQSYTSASTITLGGLYDTGDGTFTASGSVNLSGPTTFNPGSGSLSVSGALTGSADLAVLGSAGATFASVNLDNTGTIDLSGKTGGSFTVNGPTDAAALVTGTNPYSLALLGGGIIGDPTLANTGGDTLAGSFVFSGGLTVPGTLTLGGPTELNEETGGITLGTVNQGDNIFIVVADAVSLNGPWNGTGPRGITPFSNVPINLNDPLNVSPNSWVLTDAELQILADPPAFVVIGGGTAITQEIVDIEHKTFFVPKNPPGPLDVGTFTFDAPLFLIGSSINIDGTFSQTSGGVGFISPGAIGGLGSLDLGLGTGILAVAASSAVLHGTVNGSSGGAAAHEVVLIGPPGTGTFTVNGACFACNKLNLSLLGSLFLFSNDLNKANLATGGLEGETGGGGGLGNISPSAGGSDDNTPTDQAVTALTGPLNTKPPSQAQPRMQGYYATLLGGMLYEWRELPGARQGNTNPEEDTDFSGWGNEAKW